MKILPAEVIRDNGLTTGDEEESPVNGHIDCPFCKNSWVTIEDDSADLVRPQDCACPHLRFILVQDSDGIEYYNGFDALKLQQDIKSSVRQNNPDLDEETWSDFLNSNQFNIEFWEALDSLVLTHVFKYTQESIACGPSSHTVLFGVSYP
jgi:hypothetical protein